MPTSIAARAFCLVALSVTCVAVIGCSEDSGKNPAEQLTNGFGRNSGNGLALSASPATVVIDPDDPGTPIDRRHGNKPYGETRLIAVATDPAGVPQAGRAIPFGAPVGRLARGGRPVATDATGTARDTFRVYADDPDLIQVSAEDGTRVSTLIVRKVVVLPPVARAGSDQVLECTGHRQAMVRLDGMASIDPNDDLTRVEWFENYGTPSQLLLGTSETLTLPLSVGSHTITLKATDATAKSSTDEVVIRIVDASGAFRGATELEGPDVAVRPEDRVGAVGVVARVDLR